MFTYQGSKRLELKYILSFLPNMDNIQKTADIFGGAGNIYLALAKDYINKEHYYNEFDPAIYNIFYAVADGRAEQVEEEYLKMLNHKDTDELRQNRHRIYDLIKVSKDNATPANMLYMIRTAGRGFWDAPHMVRLGPIPQKNKINHYINLVNKKENITNKDYIEIMNKFKNDESAFLYLDPPYNSKNVNTQTYKRMSGGYHNYLIFIEQFFRDPETKCKVMLNIDFTGDVYMRFKEYIKLVYPIIYNINQRKKDISVPKQYHCIICNYEPRQIKEEQKK